MSKYRLTKCIYSLYDVFTLSSKTNTLHIFKIQIHTLLLDVINLWGAHNKQKQVCCVQHNCGKMIITDPVFSMTKIIM